ncbi:hypothetical protein, partial [Tatumella punctata]
TGQLPLLMESPLRRVFAFLLPGKSSAACGVADVSTTLFTHRNAAYQPASAAYGKPAAAGFCFSASGKVFCGLRCRGRVHDAIHPQERGLPASFRCLWTARCGGFLLFCFRESLLRPAVSRTCPRRYSPTGMRLTGQLPLLMDSTLRRVFAFMFSDSLRRSYGSGATVQYFPEKSGLSNDILAESQ